MHRIASVCNPTDLFCRNTNSIVPYALHRAICIASHRTICTASDHMHRIASVCNPTDLFCRNKNSIRPYASHRIRPYAPHRIGFIVADKTFALSRLGKKWYEKLCSPNEDFGSLNKPCGKQHFREIATPDWART